MVVHQLVTRNILLFIAVITHMWPWVWRLYQIFSVYCAVSATSVSTGHQAQYAVKHSLCCQDIANSY